MLLRTITTISYLTTRLLLFSFDSTSVFILKAFIFMVFALQFDTKLFSAWCRFQYMI